MKKITLKQIRNLYNKYAKGTNFYKDYGKTGYKAFKNIFLHVKDDAQNKHLTNIQLAKRIAKSSKYTPDITPEQASKESFRKEISKALRSNNIRIRINGRFAKIDTSNIHFEASGKSASGANYIMYLYNDGVNEYYLIQFQSPKTTRGGASWKVADSLENAQMIVAEY